MSRPTEELRTLQPNWNSYGALPLCPVACDRADALVLLLRELGHAPSVVPTVGGGVLVEWDGPRSIGSVEYLPGGAP